MNAAITTDFVELSVVSCQTAYHKSGDKDDSLFIIIAMEKDSFVCQLVKSFRRGKMLQDIKTS